MILLCMVLWLHHAWTRAASSFCSRDHSHKADASNTIVYKTMLGIAFSGGGICAAISAACAWNALVDMYPSINNSSSTDIMISTVSGGTIGYALWSNARDKIKFTKYKRDLMLEDLMDMTTSDDVEEENQADKMPSVGEIAKQLSSISFIKKFFLRQNEQSELHWWTRLIQHVFESIDINEINTGSIDWLTSFAYINDGETLSSHDGNGYLLPSSANLINSVLVNMNHGDGSISVLGNNHHPSPMRIKRTMSTLDSLSFSSSFWAAPIVSNPFLYAFFKNALIKQNRSLFEEKNEEASCSSAADKTSSNVVILDGGVVDTTGIIGLLHRQVDDIVVFYNNNVPLSQVQSPISYLFGVETPTDAMNSLKGPSLSQIFPSHIFPDVIANLTDQVNGVALLKDIQILPNTMGVEPYTVNSIVIFSNGFNTGFTFEDDARIMNGLSSDWPDRYSFSLPKLDANAMCSFNDWKVRHHYELLDPLLLQASAAV
jgi:hypothetical protein